MSKKSHAAVWSAEAPTPAQLSELFQQIKQGRVTRERMQDFLQGGSGRVYDSLEGVDLSNFKVAEYCMNHLEKWREAYPGKEYELANALFPMLDGYFTFAGYHLRPEPDELKAYQQAIFWRNVQGVIVLSEGSMKRHEIPTLQESLCYSLWDRFESEEPEDVPWHEECVWSVACQKVLSKLDDSIIETNYFPDLRGFPDNPTGSWSDLNHMISETLLACIDRTSWAIAHHSDKYDFRPLLRIWYNDVPLGFNPDNKLVVICPDIYEKEA